MKSAARDSYAHSKPGFPISAWEPLATHLAAVAERAATFAGPFGWPQAARVTGALHDIGKCSPEFLAYIKGERPRGPDHSTAGARAAAAANPGLLGLKLAFIIAGHHAGLADYEHLAARLDPAIYRIPAYDGWQDETGPLPPVGQMAGPMTRGEAAGFCEAMLTRMLFSCLVDADFLETERFCSDDAVARGQHLDLATLHDRLDRHMAALRAQAPASPLNTLRAEILDHVSAAAARPPGVFTLTVPTGGGKTLASLSFALAHAVRHRLRRVVYVAPYTAIIEQTATVFRSALGTDDDVLEHHASFEWEPANQDDEGRDGLAKLRLAAENWDVPVVVTTAVQFFESLFAARGSRCRKLHNLAGAVVVLDEAQSLPLPLLRPCVAALRELARNYGASVVLCTATQPALRAMDGFPGGFEINDSHELAPDPARLYTALRRVAVERLAAPVGDEVIAEAFAGQAQMLCIVNSRAHARALFDRIAALPGAVHLTTLMCPAHRRAVLAELRQRLKDGHPVRLVATSLIEAGVDIDFPEVWRAATGLDSIAQAAGRCNREARAALGRVVVFEPAETPPPRALLAACQSGASAMRRHADAPLGLAAIHDYFAELYWQRGPEALDAARLDGQTWPILPALAERARDFCFPFASIARAFRMIDEAMAPVIVPWRATPEDRTAEAVLGRIAGMERPRASDLRRLQQYTVPIPPQLRAAWLAQGVLRPVHAGVPELLRLDDLAQYRDTTGLDIADPSRRSAESNVIS
jgi:CRISPR-associated endonuclease/helicase Cas3